MKKLSLIFAFVLGIGIMAFAQPSSNLVPNEVNAEDATITELGHATMTVEVKIVTNSLTRRPDTLYRVTQIEWDTPSGTAKQRNAERGGNNPDGSGFFNEGHNIWFDIYYYNFNYPSINAEGQPVLLSAMACMPDEDCDYINNVIIGCHVTITSNKQCPSSYKNEGEKASDVGMLMNHATSGMLFHSAQSDRAYYNLVIMPDYEGYGITKSHAHPYLYQELTARQVVDGVRYGIALYHNSPIISSIRHSFRDGWRSICVGYSQGGSVAMATQRFIEQNNLTDELHLAGSVCGDGPYDPIATLMYYTKQFNDGYPMSMPVVLPLILKGMCDSNPYMKNHQVSDYLSQHFLNTNILMWLTEKVLNTDQITAAWITHYLNLPDHDQWVIPSSGIPYSGYSLTLKMGYIMQSAGLDYFQTLYNNNHNTYTSAASVPLPLQRSLMQDLHFALASNNLTKGWVPQHTVCLYHSYDDSVVPEVNRQSALNSLGNWVVQLHASGVWQFNHEGSGRQFFLGSAEFDAIRELSKLPVRQTIQHAINVKNNLPEPDVDPSSSIEPANNVVLAPITLDGVEINAEYTLFDNYAYLGSGYNACIPQYSVGKVVVPAIITVEGTVYPVQEVSNVAFRMCSHITEVVLPEGIYNIGNFAFQGCQALTKVTLPYTLGTIGTGAFIDLPRLTTIDVKATTPPVWQYNDVFKFHAEGIGDTTIYSYESLLLVPEGKVQTYRQALYDNPDHLGWTTPDGWGHFTNIAVGADPDAEAYAAYYPHEHSLTFYYDSHRLDRVGMTTYGLTDLSENHPGLPAWYDHKDDITSVVFSPLFQYAHPTSTSKWFSDFTQLDTIIGLYNLTTDAVTDMSNMFQGCTGLNDDDLDFSNFNTASVTSMLNMFKGCTGLVSPDLSSFNTHSCTNMQNMFDGCTNLTSIDMSSFETSERNFSFMFQNCTNLTEVLIGSLGTTGDYVCNFMFTNCSKLSTIVIPSSFNNLRNAFGGCTGMRDVYCYKPVPFEEWVGRDNDFETIPLKYTRFHVLQASLNDWVAAYGPDTETPANVTFVGDLGTDENPFLLYSTADWVNLGQMVNCGHNINAKMMNDFSVTTMIGSTDHPFVGTFDGNGHTLTVDYSISDEITQNDIFPAPFVVIRNATIKNLRVDGAITVTSERNAAAGLVGVCFRPVNNESATNVITNCHVSTQIAGIIHFMGGIVAGVDEHVSTTISGCLFDGQLYADHDYYLVHDVKAGAIVCDVDDAATVSVIDCMENGSYQNADTYTFCPITTTNSYRFTDDLTGNAKRAYSITTDTEGLVLDFGTTTATYDVSGITAYSTGLKLNDIFHAGAGENISVTITAPGYQYEPSSITFTGNATFATADYIHYTIAPVSTDVVVSMPGMVFTTIILHADARDNSLKLDNYIDEAYNVQFDGQTLRKSVQWNPLCLPFDLPSLNNTPLQNYTMLRVLDTITFENKVAIYHFKDATSITADNLYLIKVPQDIVNPTYNHVTIKRSSAPGMKVEAVEDLQTGFVIRGNYNSVDLVDLDPDGDLHSAFYYDGTSLRKVSGATHLNAFKWSMNLYGVTTDDVVACLIDIEDAANGFVVLDNRYSDVDDIFIHNGNWDEYENWAKKTIPANNQKVLIEAQATIPADCTAEANEIVIDNGSVTIKDGGQFIHSTAGLRAVMEKDIAAYTSDNDGWNVEASEGGAVAPCTGIVVKAEGTENEAVVFTKNAPQQQNANHGSLHIALSQVVEPVEGPARNSDSPATLRQAQGPTLLDNAIVSFNEGELLEKFVFNADLSKLYIPQNGKDYAIVNAEKQGEIPLNFVAKEDGQYTLSLSSENVAFNYLHLIDNMTGADIDLLHPQNVIAGEDPQSPTPMYTFTANTTDYESRFKLVFCAKTDGPSTGSGTFAFIDASGNIIVNDGPSTGSGTLQVIDVTGRIIRCTDVARNVSTAGMTPGVYVLRLIDGNDVRTQKIMIR